MNRILRIGVLGQRKNRLGDAADQATLGAAAGLVGAWFAANYGGDPNAVMPTTNGWDVVGNGYVWSPVTNQFIQAADLAGAPAGQFPRADGTFQALPTVAAGVQPFPWLPPTTPPGTAPVQGTCAAGQLQAGQRCLCPIGQSLTTLPSGQVGCANWSSLGIYAQGVDGFGNPGCANGELFDPNTGLCAQSSKGIAPTGGSSAPLPLPATTPAAAAPATPNVVEDHTMRNVLLGAGALALLVGGYYALRGGSKKRTSK